MKHFICFRYSVHLLSPIFFTCFIFSNFCSQSISFFDLEQWVRLRKRDWVKRRSLTIAHQANSITGETQSPTYLGRVQGRRQWSFSRPVQVWVKSKVGNRVEPQSTRGWCGWTCNVLSQQITISGVSHMQIYYSKPLIYHMEF